MDDDRIKITVSEWRWFPDKEGDIRITGFIQNSSIRPLSSATVQYRICDPQGQFIGAAFFKRDFASPLLPGEFGAFSFWELRYGRSIGTFEFYGIIEILFDDNNAEDE